jgi:hypothetical protein
VGADIEEGAMLSRGAELLRWWMDADRRRTQAVVARAACVEQGTVSRWLSGQRPTSEMSVSSAVEISRLTEGGVPVESWGEPASCTLDELAADPADGPGVES